MAVLPSHQGCCTCARLLSAVPCLSSSSEKPLPSDRFLDCCGRIVCGSCLQNNPRFLRYCPFCQGPGSSLTAHRLMGPRAREPESNSTPAATIFDPPPPYQSPAPAITASAAAEVDAEDAPPPPPPPPYTSSSPSPFPQRQLGQQTSTKRPEYTVHNLRHPHDTIPSLSLRYGIPPAILRQHNNLTSDHLLAARQTILIPTAHCTRPEPPSPTPDGGSHEEQDQEDAARERARKTAIRRWMVACKEPDYDVAVVYLEEVGYDVGVAVRRYAEDERWVREHPCPSPLGLERKRGRKSWMNGGGSGVGVGVGGNGRGFGWMGGFGLGGVRKGEK
ncbi:hypothetical protein VTK26DRAFT_6179 [Humicola hyalothermophila]